MTREQIVEELHYICVYKCSIVDPTATQLINQCNTRKGCLHLIWHISRCAHAWDERAIELVWMLLDTYSDPHAGWPVPGVDYIPGDGVDPNTNPGDSTATGGLGSDETILWAEDESVGTLILGEGTIGDTIWPDEIPSGWTMR